MLTPQEQAVLALLREGSEPRSPTKPKKPTFEGFLGTLKLLNVDVSATAQFREFYNGGYTAFQTHDILQSKWSPKDASPRRRDR